MENNFLFHKVSKDELDLIKQQAKNILDNFSDKISKISLPKDNPGIKREFSMREEKFDGDKIDMNKEIFFKNALTKNKNFIFVEKKKW